MREAKARVLGQAKVCQGHRSSVSGANVRGTPGGSVRRGSTVGNKPSEGHACMRMSFVKGWYPNLKHFHGHQERLDRCLYVMLVKGRADTEMIKAWLEARARGGDHWKACQVSQVRLLAVSNSEERTIEMAEGGFLVANQVVMRVQRWSMAIGTFPSPRVMAITLTLQGIPLVLCDEEGVSSLISKFAMVESESRGRKRYDGAGRSQSFQPLRCAVSSHFRC